MPRKRTTRAERVGLRPYRNRVDLTCDVCGKVYSRPVSQSKTAHHFCSVACKSTSQERPVELVCQWCERPFQRPASLSHRRFCSNSCSRQAQYNRDTQSRVIAGAVRCGLILNGSQCLTRSQNIMTGGYSGITWKNRVIGAHVLAWTLANGPVPEGMEVSHLCHTPNCVEVAHLTVETHQENMQRSSAAGRLGKRPLA